MTQSLTLRHERSEVAPPERDISVTAEVNPDIAIKEDPDRGRLRRRLPGGVLDSGFSSLATFASGFLAVHYESTALLGAYALGLSALAMAGALTSVWAFTATETAVVRDLPPERRAYNLTRSVPCGAWLALAMAVVVSAGTLLVPSQVSLGDRLELGAACVFVSAVSPLQDHIRRMLHIGYDSWGAARVSFLQFLIVLVASGLALELGLQSRPWVPFVALGLANAASGLFGLARVNRGKLHRRDSSAWPGLRSSFIFGRELGFSSLVNFGCGSATFAVVIATAGSASAGEAEGARVLAQPITVVAVGLISALGADLMSAARGADVRRLRRLIGGLLGLLFLLTVAWTAISFRQWSWSPLPQLAPSAYLLPGLLLLTVPGQVVGYAAQFGLVVAQAADALRKFALVQMVCSITALIITVLLARHGAWALGIGALAGGSLLLLAALLAVIGPRKSSWLPATASALP